MSSDANEIEAAPAAALEGIRRCHDESGRDMQDIGGVLRWLRDNGWYTAADWVEQNTDTYLSAIANPGFWDSGRVGAASFFV